MTKQQQQINKPKLQVIHDYLVDFMGICPTKKIEYDEHVEHEPFSNKLVIIMGTITLALYILASIMTK